MRQQNFKQRQIPDLQDVLEDLKEDVLKSINCVQVGQIEGFDASNQTVSVQIAVKQVIDEDFAGVKRFQDISVLLQVPCVFLGNSTSYLTIPPVVGDNCIVLFNDRDIENWYIRGGLQGPNSFRKHDLSDGLAIVGIRNTQNLIDGFLDNGVRLQFNDSNKMELKSGTIETTTPLLKQNGDFQVTNNATVDNVLFIGTNVQKLGGGTLPVVGDFDVSGGVSASTLSAGNGATGTFTSLDGKTITVTDGIIVNIV